MPGITERDVAYDMLYATKANAELYCHAALESAHHNVYHLFRELEHHTHESQHRIWEYLHRRNEYRVEEAHPRDIEDTRQRMERLAQDHLTHAGRGDYGRYPNTTVGGGYGGTPAWSTSGANYGTGTAYGSGYGSGGSFAPSYGGTESRSDWNRGESSRNLPDWAREPTRR
jgi:hypothetical protein